MWLSSTYPLRRRERRVRLKPLRSTSASRSRLSIGLPRLTSSDWPPLLVGAALAGIIGLQIAIPPHTDLPDGSALAPRRLRNPVPVPIPDYAAIRNVPVFTPDRRPGSGPGASVQNLQLVGVAVFGRSVASAVLRSADGATHIVRKGESLQGWNLVSVTVDQAEFSGPAGRLRLVVNTAAAASAPSPNPGVTP